MRYTLYFAYGSNMNEAQFKLRCPASHFLCRARLPDYRFIINSSGYATVLPKPGSVVHGVLTAITEADEQELDRREGVHENIYRREQLEVITEFGYAIPALIYIDGVQDEGPPRPGYLEKVLAGAQRHDLPPEYVAEISRWGNQA
jgi:gamma-glutamylcyclotransferase (GGCT)/AIG2-like uncharacterized protein YtfP